MATQKLILNDLHPGSPFDSAHGDSIQAIQATFNTGSKVLMNETKQAKSRNDQQLLCIRIWRKNVYLKTIFFHCLYHFFRRHFFKNYCTQNLRWYQ